MGLEAPEPELDMEKVGELIETAIKDIPKAVKKNEADFPKQIKKADPDPFVPTDNTMKLTKESTEKDIVSSF